jgi:hypothetical protein
MSVLGRPPTRLWTSMCTRTLVHGALALACSASMLGGCLAVRTPEAGAPVRLAEGEGVVFGRLRVFDRGIETDPWKIELSEIVAE